MVLASLQTTNPWNTADELTSAGIFLRPSKGVCDWLLPQGLKSKTEILFSIRVEIPPL